MAGKSTGNLLPPDFKDLEKFAEDWAIPHEADRYRFRASRSIEELQELYDAVLPRLDAISDGHPGPSDGRDCTLLTPPRPAPSAGTVHRQGAGSAV